MYLETPVAGKRLSKHLEEYSSVEDLWLSPLLNVEDIKVEQAMYVYFNLIMSGIQVCKLRGHL